MTKDEIVGYNYDTINTNCLKDPGRIVKNVLIWKCELEYSDDIMLECHLIFDDDSEVQYIIGDCELEEDEYSRGIYEYKNGEYITIENWDE